jgi:hypothetical protein
VSGETTGADRHGAPSRAEIDDVVVSYVPLQGDTIPNPLAFSKPGMSVHGTFETCKPFLKMSASGARPEVNAARSTGEIDPERTFRPAEDL